MINIINQIFEIEKKAKEQNLNIFDRNVERIYHELDEMGYHIENPLGKFYDERDASIEANLVGNSSHPKITKVLKPAIFEKDSDNMALVQKAIVIAE